MSGSASAPKLAFVNAYRDKRSEKSFHYFRSTETGRIRLPDDAESAAFFAAYAARAAGQDSLGALINAYLRSADYRALADPTQIDYARTCDVLRKEMGDQPNGAHSLRDPVMGKAFRRAIDEMRLLID